MGFIALRDKFTTSLSKYNFGNPLAEGSAQIEFITTSGTNPLPEIGDSLHDYDFYCSGSATTTYPNIKLGKIEQIPYHVVSGSDGFKYICSFQSETNNDKSANSFSGDTTIVSWESPDRWRLATRITSPTSVAGDIFGNFDAKQSRIVPSGSFGITKLVDDGALSPFWYAYLDIVGRLNYETIVAVKGDTAGIEFQRGQVLCSGIEMGDRTDSGLWSFNIMFRWRLINSKDIGGENIVYDDFNFYLAPNPSGTIAGGWCVPVQTQGTASSTLSSNPFTYEYAADGKYNTFLDADWSTAL